ncbi:helix-turn-helix domain-containing protein [Cohnella sp. CFH 77786]|uniref:helix-turn-helix domain-containing protein n=1 Tax=Cohnella sp. CFH 77786 TaxID=2662265 RepID=UPI001C6098A3|nr:helix-turn-helix domain-containing protein [Cohnella sp. CFH 77786]MBW5447138.1 helix-turn-helix domain-containing protein [Cohnella sp. CFH 77786]
MKPSEQSSDKGILSAEAGRRSFFLERFEPSEDLAAFVEFYRSVRWDLTGQAPYRQTVLSYPNVHLVFEKDSSGIHTLVYGVPKRTYTRELKDKGLVFGIKFKPGGFHPFWKRPVSRLAGLSVGAGELLGVDIGPAEERVFAEENGGGMIAGVEDFLRERAPLQDPNAEIAAQFVEAVMSDRDIAKVEDLADRFGMNARALQRLFSRYVGASPKWVIQRFRLQEAAHRIQKGDVPNWSQLSHELGYDQAHFIKDFKAMIGKSPEKYAKASRL